VLRSHQSRKGAEVDFTDEMRRSNLRRISEAKTEGVGTLNPDPIHSDLDDIVTRGLPPGLELNLDRGKSLPAGWQTIVPDTDDTPATALPNRWELGDDRAKMLPSTNSELDDDEAWKLVPYFGAVLLFFSWIVQSWTRREKGQSGQAQV
jgi:hypothetical protein